MKTHNTALSPSANNKILLNNVCNIITSVLWTFKSFLALKVFQMNLHYFRIFSIVTNHSCVLHICDQGLWLLLQTT